MHGCECVCAFVCVHVRVCVCMCLCMCVHVGMCTQAGNTLNSLDQTGDQGHGKRRPFSKPFQQDVEAIQLPKAIHQVHKPTLWTYETPILPQWEEGQYTGRLKWGKKMKWSKWNAAPQEKKKKSKNKYSSTCQNYLLGRKEGRQCWQVTLKMQH